VRREIAELQELAVQAQKVQDSGVEAKLSRLRDLLHEEGFFDQPDKRLLIFTEFKDTLDYLMAKFAEWGFRVGCIHGGMKPGSRDEPGSRLYAEQQFKDGEIQVLVATEAAGEGINLQVCHILFNYDIPWNPNRLEQRMGRIHRYGQKKDCLIFNFVATNTIEGHVLKRLLEKLQEIRNALNDDAVFNVVGEVLPAAQVERVLRDYYSGQLGEADLEDRLLHNVDEGRFRAICQNALEGLASKKLNLEMLIERRAQAQERRVVPETIARFLAEASGHAGLSLKPVPHLEHKPTILKLVKEEFKRGASVPTEVFETPFDGTKVSDTPRLSVWVVDPEAEWTDNGIRQQIAEFTKNRGKSSRLYPGAIVWCVRKPGRDLRDKVELMLAWKKVQKDVAEGVLGQDYEKADLQEIQVQVKEAEDDARDEIWAVYRFVVLADQQQPDGLKVIDLGAGHSSTKETLCGRIIGALKADALLNESVGAGYIERNWPPAFKESGAWPLASLRQSFLNGALTRLLDPDAVLRNKCIEFVSRGEFGLASGPQPDGSFQRVWFKELPSLDEVTFDPGVLLLRKDRAEAIKKGPAVPTPPTPAPGPAPGPQPTQPEPTGESKPEGGVVTPPPTPTTQTLRVAGTLPHESWNRLGTKIIPKLRGGTELTIDVTFTTRVDSAAAQDLTNEVKQILNDLNLSDSFTID
jgi:hypothetical protein